MNVSLPQLDEYGEYEKKEKCGLFGVWGTPDAVASEEAFEAFARHHLELGFTDISVVPKDVPEARLRSIALEIIPGLRSEFGRVQG